MNFDLSVCTLSERDSDGFARCQAEPYGSEGSAPSREIFAPFGLYSRPKDRSGGIGASLFVLRHGDDVRAMPGPDPRWVGLLPDAGDGGLLLHATTDLSGEKKTPHVVIFGEGGAAAEGLFRISIPSSAGTTTIEISPSSGDVTITHAAGTKLLVKNTGVEIGAEGGQAPAFAAPLEAWAATVETRLASLGQSGTAPAGVAATKVKLT